MRRPRLLAAVAAALLAGVPLVPAMANPLAVHLADVHPRCSLLDLAIETHLWKGLTPEEAMRRNVRPAGCGMRTLALMEDDLSPGFDGRAECAAFLVLALVAGLAALFGRTRRLSLVAVPLVGIAGWTWWQLRADVIRIVRDLPGGTEGLRLSEWILPFPWFLAAGAAVLLAVASLGPGPCVAAAAGRPSP
jgi:hypothetical protein